MSSTGEPRIDPKDIYLTTPPLKLNALLMLPESEPCIFFSCHRNSRCWLFKNPATLRVVGICFKQIPAFFGGIFERSHWSRWWVFEGKRLGPKFNHGDFTLKRGRIFWAKAKDVVGRSFEHSYHVADERQPKPPNKNHKKITASLVDSLRLS